MKAKTVRTHIKCALLTTGVVLGLFGLVHAATSGNIDPIDKYAWSTNTGWINFDPTHGGVMVYPDHLEGYAWAENVGWIRLGAYTDGGAYTYANTSNADYGVNVDGSGNLSGYAWGTNIGWINFDPTHGGVSIDKDTGSFDGYAWAENVGWIHFKNTGAVGYNVVAILANLSVSKQADPALVKPGEQLTYTIHITNTGSITLTATVTDVLPAFVAPSGMSTWTIPSLAPGGIWTQTVVVTAELGYAGPLTNVVQVTTVEGAAGVYTDTSAVLPSSPCLHPLEDVAISGPTEGYTNTLYSFTTTITPGDATAPITYTWSPSPTLGQGEVSASYQWDAPGVHTLTLFAKNCGAPAAVVVSDTHTITIRVTPPPGDAYEPDDTCAQAQSIPADGSVQVHTFHDTGDEDWVFLEVVYGTEYLIEAVTPVDSLADVGLELYAACGDVPTRTQDHSFSPDVRLLFTAPLTGTLKLRLRNSVPDIAGTDVSYHLSIRSLAETATPGALVLVAGRLKLGDPLQNNIHSVTNGIYNLFLEHGYPKDRIYYLATDLSMDADGNGFPDDVDAAPDRTTLETVITTWAAGKQLGPERAFTLYLMDHGGGDKFYLNGPSQTVNPDELDAWLSTLEATAPGVRVNVIMEACHSGSFVDSLGKEGRVVIASTAAHAVAYASQDGAIFSDTFLEALERGLSLYGSFQEAQWDAVTAHPDQISWLDDDGDGWPNRESDGLEASRRGFAYAGTFAAEEKWPPYIVWAQVRDRQDNEGVIEAEVRDDRRVDFVWAVIYKPSYTPPDPDVTEEMPREILSTVTLLDPESDGIYSARYEGFDEVGEYRLVIYATDNEDLDARPRAVELVTGVIWEVYLPLVLRNP